ncbi:hypothetical protein [Leifsonia sp. P73]|uniref:hypothetical protein n=1 Tax=Leifsonia sp. P73 TaxID=3423959 RepID=UPI003DA3F33E
MSLIATLRMLWHRWYITFPGLLLAGLCAAGIWYTVPPSYERSATELLLPGKNDYPVGSNPLLYVGGLTSSADVLTRAVSADNVLKEVTKDHPGTDVTVQRDGSTSTPLIVITVTSKTNADARDVLSAMVARTASELSALQESQHIKTTDRITVEPITVATKSTLQQRTRLVLTVAAGAALAALALLIAALTEGLSRKRRRRADAVEASAADGLADDGPADDGPVDAGPADDAPAVAAPLPTVRPSSGFPTRRRSRPSAADRSRAPSMTTRRA